MNKGKIQTGLLAGTWGIFAIVMVWRCVLAGSVLSSTSLVDMFGAAVVHWRGLDEFLPWMVVAILLLGGTAGVTAQTLGQARVGRVLAVLLAAGAVLTGLGLAADECGWFDGRGLGLTGLILMAVFSLYISGREVKAVAVALRAPGQPGGVTILDLWRFTAAQWGLLMVAATLFIWATVSKDEMLGNEAIRNLLFIVPAAGALPCALMAAGIAWWDHIVRAGGAELRSAAKPRVRAWVVALVLNTAGGLLLVLRAPWAAVPGTLLEAAAVAFYLVGFPRLFWRGLGGKIVLAAWMMLLLALGAFCLERILALGDQTVSTFYSSAWRQLWIAAALLALAGMGTVALERLTPPPSFAGMRRMIAVSTGFILAGAVLTTAVLLLNTTRTGNEQIDVMRWLIVGTAPSVLGVLLAGLILWRVNRLR